MSDSNCFRIVVTVTRVRFSIDYNNKHVTKGHDGPQLFVPGPFPFYVMDAMGQGLRDPGDGGDVKFQCSSSSNAEDRFLYAHSVILRTRSKYFSRSSHPSCIYSLPVFSSSFAEGDSATAAKLCVLPSDSDHFDYYPRRIIPMEDDFDVVHNILYYLYTGKIYFCTESQPSYREMFYLNSPKICDAEEIYALAHRLELNTLQMKALSFLRLSCNPRNITTRVFGAYASVYEEMGKVYKDYFRKNSSEIHAMAEFEGYFRELEEIAEREEIVRVNKRYRELMKDASFRSK